MLPYEVGFSSLFISHWSSITEQLGEKAKAVAINGHRLDLASVVSTARHGGHASLDPAATGAIRDSAEAVQVDLSHGSIIYGVNTGFGGSANTRTNATGELQKALMHHLHAGILADHPKASSKAKDLTDHLARTSLPVKNVSASTCMPEAWVRAAMLIRLNSLAGGVSGIRECTINTLVELLDKNVVPRVPMRGSISASGDLSPLSYIGGLMQGNPAITAWVGDVENRRIARADQALAEANIKPVKLIAKEGLAIVNGTAISAGVASLALHDVLCLAGLAQILTSMSVEALRGTDESFDPFFAEVRLHAGQKECAQNIFFFLSGSKLVHRSDGSEEASLRQDRYSLRTASQWIGPVLEDLVLAHRQLTVELNSVTDNPLIDVHRNKMLHGGNFQAMSVTSAMEKARQGCQIIGRMLFVQCTEMMNPAMNQGLPPNLAVDEPSESYLFKGADVIVAALQSELCFLANPVSSCVQTAEMGNQALNSLALVSSRYTIDAVEVLMQLACTHLLALCHALDHRVMALKYLETFSPIFTSTTRETFKDLIQGPQAEDMLPTLWTAFTAHLDKTTTLDSSTRFHSIITSLKPIILAHAPKSAETLHALEAWGVLCSEQALQTHKANRAQYMRNPDARPWLGAASKRLYGFVRGRLGIPFFGEGILADSHWDLGMLNGDVNGKVNGEFNGDDPTHHEAPSIGYFITLIFDALRSGAMYPIVVKCLQECK
ncbi:MAG: hypothetical protein MMC33_009866 [Icmadophila ericetorum]|nr:hypothetical protein [Icmadophila ericetorum]